MMQTVNDQGQLADRAFAEYNFGAGVTVTDSSGWEYVIPGNERSRKVYVESPREDDGPAPRWQLTFTVRFDDSDGTLAEAYAIDTHGSIWGFMPEPKPEPSAAVIQVTQRDATLVFLRYERSRVTTVGLLNVRTSLTTNAALEEGLKDATTHWVKTTQTGRELWDYSSADLNIGDLAGSSAFEDAALLAAMRERGIEYVSCFVGDSHAVSFDTVLVNEHELEEAAD